MPAAPATSASRSIRGIIKFYAVCTLLSFAWFLLLYFDSDDLRPFPHSRSQLALVVVIGVFLTATFSRPLIQGARQWWHLPVAFVVLEALSLSFVAACAAVFYVPHLISGRLLLPSLFGSLFVVLLAVGQYAYLRWYALLPMLLFSYAALKWATLQRRSAAV